MYHGAVDKHSSKQRFRKSDEITFIVSKIWSPIAIVEPGLTAGSLADENVVK